MCYIVLPSDYWDKQSQGPCPVQGIFFLAILKGFNAGLAKHDSKKYSYRYINLHVISLIILRVDMHMHTHACMHHRWTKWKQWRHSTCTCSSFEYIMQVSLARIFVTGIWHWISPRIKCKWHMSGLMGLEKTCGARTGLWQKSQNVQKVSVKHMYGVWLKYMYS